MHDFSQWLQSADTMDEKVCVFLVFRVSKDGTKLGLYDTDGKALKPVGKD